MNKKVAVSQIKTAESVMVGRTKVEPLATLLAGDQVLQIWRDGEEFKMGVSRNGEIVQTVEQPVLAGNKKAGITIMYVGKRSPQAEPQFGTGVWEKEQVKMVSPDAAVKLLREYPGLFVRVQRVTEPEVKEPEAPETLLSVTEKTEPEKPEADENSEQDQEAPEEVEEVEESEEEKEKKEAAEKEAAEQDAIDSVNAMQDVDAVKKFVSLNFAGQKLHHSISNLDTAKQKAIQMISQFGLP